ncbi:T9SS type A sorting domain-containing protein [Portibacter marinus]|uniref:T9SS type A sorting domain-containing protein n=1 Tax=Portibacter marinus TaxID=2898660 RepID=UPI001F386C1F|nr:T9SS type A sorting domain-containing protein [Portibacter marinus]
MPYLYPFRRCAIVTLLTALVCLVANGQSCPEQVNRKNSSCLSVTYNTVEEALAAIANQEVITVTNSTGGSADGVYNATIICETRRVIFDKGSSSCNCQGYNGTTNGTFQFAQTGLTCNYNAAGSVLPVEYAKIEVVQEDEFALIQWETVTEINNEGFYVEHSIDGKRFNPIAFVDGNGNSSESLTYEFLHRNPAFGMNFYRLKQVDFNNEYEYSKMLSFNNKRHKDKLTATFINSSEVLIQGSSDHQTVQLFSLSGALLQKMDKLQGETILNLSNFPSGIYVLKAYNQIGETQIVRLVKS